MNLNKNSEDIEEYVERASFDDRICDDLCETILQMLSIEDRIKLTAVSHQFRRCLQLIEMRQTILNICSQMDSNRHQKNVWKRFFVKSGNALVVDMNGFEKILKLLPNVNQLLFDRFTNVFASNQVLEVLIRNGGHLKTIQMDFQYCDQKMIEDFGLKFGQQLKELALIESYGVVEVNVQRNIFKSFPNLISISNVEFCALFEAQEVLVTNLKKAIELWNIRDKHLFDLFVDNNPTLTDLEINLNLKSCVDTCALIEKVSQLKDLNHLSIDLFDCHSYDKRMGKSIESIGLKCIKLKTFSLIVLERKSFDTKHCFKAFDKFSNLNKLIVYSINNCSLKHSIEKLDINCLKNCQKLIHLDITSDQIDDQLFVNIDSIVPNLKSLKILIKYEITDKALESMAKLNHLKSLTIRRFTGENLNQITDSGLLLLINGCIHLRKVEISYKTAITETTIKAVIQKAIKNPKILFEYEFYPIDEEIKFGQYFQTNDYCFHNISFRGE